jgi:uncharacterized membrane protein
MATNRIGASLGLICGIFSVLASLMSQRRTFDGSVDDAS